MNGAIRILLADDHGIVRQGLRSVLTRDPSFEIVGEAADGREAARTVWLEPAGRGTNEFPHWTC